MNKPSPESIDAIAHRYSALAILNCYVREIAIPNDLLEFMQDEREKIPAGMLFIKFPQLRKALSVKVSNRSAIGSYIYTSSLLIADLNAESIFEFLPWQSLSALIVEELCLRYRNDKVKQEMLDQIENSTALIKQGVAHCVNVGAEKYGDYIESESALIYGHSFHPAPKCRQGFSAKESLLYGPEFGRAFQLHYFALSPEVQWMANSSEVEMQPLVQEMGRISPHDIPAGWSLVPCHPWQANYLLQQAPIHKSIEEGILKYLGASGIYFKPTISVRTLYNANFPYFLKCSLSMRITNSVRKNAYYELDAAVRLTKILLPVVTDMKKQFPGFEFVLEPVALSADISHGDENIQADLRSHFGVIFRDATPFQLSPNIQNVLSATLFGDNHKGESWLEKCFNAMGAIKGTLQGNEIALEWFSLYLSHLVQPLLSAYFEQGVVCEPHLQNVVVKLENGWPVGVILRDLEGTKLIKGMWDESLLNGMQGKTLASVLHDENKTWQRLNYCLFVNHLGQVIYQICRFGLNEQQLWEMVRKTLERFSASVNSELVERRIGGLLKGNALIAKANLITRFFQHADSDASYVLLPNPMVISVEEVKEYA
jgi:siderophore synthetase component